MNVFTTIATVGSLYQDGIAFGKAVQTALADPLVKAEIAADPGVSLIVARLSAELRTVENDVTGVKKSSFFTFLPRVSALLTAAGLLERDIAAEQHDPAIGAALTKMPNTLAALSKISAQYVKLEVDIKAFK